jgi:hypothetical protein
MSISKEYSMPKAITNNDHALYSSKEATPKAT